MSEVLLLASYAIWNKSIVFSLKIKKAEAKSMARKKNPSLTQVNVRLQSQNCEIQGLFKVIR